MLPLLPSFMVAQIVTAPAPITEQQFLTQIQEIRSLPGKLNEVPVFNSNSPEIVQTEGILLSTFPSNGKFEPRAHLNKPLKGRFDIFTHHISRPIGTNRTLYQGLIIENPTNQYVTVRVLQGASYLTSPDAPFIDLPQQVEDPYGQVFSGPGSRLMSDILRGITQPNFPRILSIPPQESAVLFNLPINTSSARSTYMRLESNGPVYLANLAMFAVPEVLPEEIATKDNKSAPSPKFRQPSLNDWRNLLVGGRLVYPRDRVPTPPEKINPNDPNRPIYGRVAGVSLGTEWKTKLVDDPKVSYLSIPERGKAFSYPLSTLNVGTQGTRQIQSAPMLARYPDTAYLAHGNYGVHYQLTLPLRNKTASKQSVSLALQTPIKQDQYSDRLFFLPRPTGQVFFRGTVRVSYVDDRGQSQNRYFHITQRQGQMGDPLIILNLSPGEQRQVVLDFLYPPDATPPQVVTVKTEQLFYGLSLRN